MRLHKQSAFLSFIAGLLASLGLQSLTAQPPAEPSAFSCTIAAKETQPAPAAADLNSDDALPSAPSNQELACSPDDRERISTNKTARTGGVFILFSALATFLWSARLADIREEISGYANLTEDEKTSKVTDIYKREKVPLLVSLGAAVVTGGLGVWLIA